jgi:hypothetical protein
MKRITMLVGILLVLAAWPALAQEDGGEVTVSGHAVQVLPLSLVTESDVEVVEVTDTTARVNFVSTVPLACYLVYGTDETFGSVTNDPNMSAAAIIDHNPVLFDLEPDTEYVFRMQGISEDGTIYVSNLYTLRTFPASESSTANLLSPDNGATVQEVSSNFGGGANDGRWGILNAFDDNAATEWSSNGDGDDAYFVVDLGGRYNVTSITYHTRAMNDGTAITELFTITTDDGETYGPFEVEAYTDLTTFEVDFETQMLRYDVETSTGGNTGIIDIAAYGTPVEAE